MLQAKILFSAFTVIGCAFSATHAVAVPVDYSESIDGDLADSSAPLPTFLLDIGLNTVAGTFGTAADGSSDFDSFAFTVPTGTEMYHGVVQTADVSVGDILSVSWRLQVGSPDFNGGTFIDFVGLGSPDTTIVSAVPLSAAIYNLSASSFVYPEVPLPALADYTFTFLVRESVPEPSAVGLAVVAGALLIGRRKLRLSEGS